MVNINSSIEAKKARSSAREELENLDSVELTTLILDTMDAKTLSVLAVSLKVARKRGERETAVARSQRDRETRKLKTALGQ